jgi:protease PrsW
MSTIWGVRRRTALRIAAVMAVLLALAFWVALGPAAFVAGVFLSVLPVPLYVSLALWLDRYKYEPARLLLKAFLWGAVVAAGIAILVNDSVLAITGSEFAASVVAAPIGEEVLKAIALLLLFYHQRHEFDNVTDGVVYATMVGLGFAMTENVYYYGGALLDGMADAVFMVRGVFSPFAHPLFTAMTGIGIGIARESTRRIVQVVAPIAGLLAAIGLHAFWNYSVDAGVFFVVYIFVMVPVFVGVVHTVRRSLRREEGILREYLRQDVVAGRLTQAELDAICAVPGRLRVSWRRILWRAPGPARCRFQETAINLAFHRWRVARGLSGDRENVTVREEEYLRHLVANAPRVRRTGYPGAEMAS